MLLIFIIPAYLLIACTGIFTLIFWQGCYVSCRFPHSGEGVLQLFALSYLFCDLLDPALFAFVFASIHVAAITISFGCLVFYS